MRRTDFSLALFGLHARQLCPSPSHVPWIGHNPRGGEKEGFEPADAIRDNERTVATRLKDEFGGRSPVAQGAAKMKSHLIRKIALCERAPESRLSASPTNPHPQKPRQTRLLRAYPKTNSHQGKPAAYLERQTASGHQVAWLALKIGFHVADQLVGKLMDRFDAGPGHMRRDEQIGQLGVE